jgi:cytochrome c biogenesis protein ResB
MLGGLALFSNGPGDGVSQEAGGKFMMLGFAIVLMGFWLVAYVAKRKDW